jgi:TRAP-type C4-dicarboxylate transport system permease small subunit
MKAGPQQRNYAMSLDSTKTWFESWVKPISRFMSHVASVILFIMMILTILDVVLRKLLSKSILGTVEVTEFMLVFVIFFTLALTELLNGHVKVDLVMSRFSERVQGMADMITQFICLIISLLITWSTIIYSEKMRLSEEVSQDLWIPVFPVIYVVAFGCALLCLALLIKFIEALIKVVKS